jgi:multicomponent Na+:H+ antiporter subunit E
VSMIGRLLLFGFWYLVWLLLAWPPERSTFLLGALVALVVYLLTHDFLSGTGLTRRPLRFLWFFCYAGLFLWECLKANLDVAYRVLHPDVPIRPGTVRVKTSLKSDLGLTFLANTLSLTPGNTSIDIDRDKGILYVHRLYLSERTVSQGDARLVVAEKFEKILRRIFE